MTLPLYAACIEIAVTRFRNREGRFSRAAIATHVIVLLRPADRRIGLDIALELRSRKQPPHVHHRRTLVYGTPYPRRLSSLDAAPKSGPIVVLPRRHRAIAQPWRSTDYLDGDGGAGGAFDRGIRAAKATSTVLFGRFVVFFRSRIDRYHHPAELAFEHRNYFASVGLLLAGASLVGLEPLFARFNVRTGVACGFVAFFAFNTLLRAEEWSHPLRLALSEASKRPHSARAQYTLAQTLIIAAGSDRSSPLLREARNLLQKTAFQPGSGIAGLQALIYLDCKSTGSIAPGLWETLIQNLRNEPPSQSDIAALEFLLHAQLHGDCPMQEEQLLDAFTAALARSDGDVNLVSAYADFAYLELNDSDLAERMFREVLRQRPTVATYRGNWVDFLIATGRFDEAEKELETLRSLNYYGSLDALLARLNKELKDARTSIKAPGPSPLSASHAKP